jgi:hypothetical protein
MNWAQLRMIATAVVAGAFFAWLLTVTIALWHHANMPPPVCP